MTEQEVRKNVSKVLEFPDELSIPCSLIGHKVNLWSPITTSYERKNHAIKAIVYEYCMTERKISRSFYNDFKEQFIGLFSAVSAEENLRVRARRKKDKLEFMSDQIIYLDDSYPASTNLKMCQTSKRTMNDFLEIISGKLTEEMRYQVFKYWFFSEFVGKNGRNDGYFFVDDLEWRILCKKMPDMIGRLEAETRTFDEQVRLIDEELMSGLAVLDFSERRKIVELWKDRDGLDVVYIVD